MSDFSDRRYAPGKVRDWKEHVETPESLELEASDREQLARKVYDEDPSYAGSLKGEALRYKIRAFRMRYEASKIAVT